MCQTHNWFGARRPTGRVKIQWANTHFQSWALINFQTRDNEGV